MDSNKLRRSLRSTFHNFSSRPVLRLNSSWCAVRSEIYRMTKNDVPILFSVYLFLAWLCAPMAQAQWTPLNPITAVQQQVDGVLFTQASGVLKVQVCSDSIIRVLYSPTSTFAKRADFVVIKQDWPATKWTMQSNDDAVTLTTAWLTIVVTRKDGAINYAEVNGGPLVQEASRKMSPVRVNGEDTYRAESFVSI